MDSVTVQGAITRRQLAKKECTSTTSRTARRLLPGLPECPLGALNEEVDDDEDDYHSDGAHEAGEEV